MSNERDKRAARAEQMRKDLKKSSRRQRNVISIGIVVVVAILIGLAAWGIQNAKPETAVVVPKGSTKDFGVVYASDKAQSPVRVVLYEDFQCPVCELFEQQAGRFLSDQVAAGRIEIEYRIVTFLDENGASLNQYSERAASAALCARDSGGGDAFKKVHDLLYSDQPEERTSGPDNQALLKVVRLVEPKVDSSCVLKARYAPWLNKADEAMSKAKVNGTPTVFIDGKKVEGAPNASGVSGMPTVADLEAAIAKAHAG